MFVTVQASNRGEECLFIDRNKLPHLTNFLCGNMLGELPARLERILRTADSRMANAAVLRAEVELGTSP